MKFKHDFDADRFKLIHPKLQFIANGMNEWCEKRGIPFVITATKTTLTEDEAEKRESSTHREGRAIDIGIHGWTQEDIRVFIEHFVFLFGELGAVGSASHKKTLLKYGDPRHLDHIHIQLNRSFAVI